MIAPAEGPDGEAARWAALAHDADAEVHAALLEARATLARNGVDLESLENELADMRGRLDALMAQTRRGF
jgi:hypothetical protein